MLRTQVYLTEKERSELAILAEATGKKLSELIREAVDRLIEESSASRRATVLDRAAGLWKNRDDLPDFRAIRAEWNRS
ncbi:MAG: ribbon-helix-helix domain-containing protein [Planctomycetes bacterium]|nr:ribbon-helix-helix domain-containing protein [Planctomycetota bacterium]